MKISAGILVFFATALVSAGSTLPAQAGWQPNGNLVSTGVASSNDPQGVPDGAGGLYLSWFEAPASARVQRLLPSGAIAPGWPVGGIALGTFPGRPALVRDPADGVFVAYSEGQGAGSLRVRRVSASGVLDVGWPAGGISLAPGYDADSLRMVADGAGGAFVVWIDNLTDTTPARGIYASRFSSGGALSPGWPLGGIQIISDGAPRARFLRGAISDELGGILVYWNDRTGTTKGVRAQRVDGSGTLLWTSGGNRVLVVSSGTKYPGIRPQTTPVIADGQGGAFFACSYGAFTDDGFEPAGDSVAVVHLASNGLPPAPWTAAGVHVGAYGNGTLASDGAGGVFVAWDGFTQLSAALFLRRIAADASTPAGWPASPVTIDSVGFPALLANGSSGAHIATFHRGIEWNISAGQVSATGALGSPATSVVCDAPDFQIYAFLVASNPGAAFVVWEDSRNSPRTDIYASRIPLGTLVDVPTPSVAFALSAPAPNPARESISFTLHGGSEAARIAVFDLRGRCVIRFSPNVGETRLVWNLRDGSGTRVAPGLYWIRASSGGEEFSRAIVVVNASPP